MAGAHGIFTVNADGTGSKIQYLVKHNMLLGSVLREIYVYTHIQHKNIAKIHKINIVKKYTNSDETRIKVVINLEAGDYNLFKYIKTANYSRKLKDFFRIFTGILRGLKAIHDNNIAHGDLKPTNIIIKNKVAKLIDFGAAQLKSNGVFNGAATTYDFVAPEDALYGDYGTYNDIWAFGITILYYFGYRTKNFKRKNDAVKWFKSNDKINIDSYQMPVFINSLIKKILVYDPTKRPTAKELLNILDHQNLTKVSYRIILSKTHINALKNIFDKINYNLYNPILSYSIYDIANIIKRNMDDTIALLVDYIEKAMITPYNFSLTNI